MATLEKIRNKAGLLVIVVGVALFAFIIGDFLRSGSTFFHQSKEKIAVVDGQSISIQNYQAKVEEMTEMYKSRSGNKSLSEEEQTQVRETVFENMINQILMDEESEKIGFTVSKDEMSDLIMGNNISPIIQQMPDFRNPQTGTFDRNMLLQFLQTIESDNLDSYPAETRAQIQSAKSYWLFWEQNIKQQQLQTKFTSLLSNAVVANSLDTKAAYENSKVSVDFDYVSQPYASIPDDQVAVSDAEIEKLYNKRKESFKQEEGKVISYISVDILPSQHDFEEVQKVIENLKPEFTTQTAVDDIVNENSDISYLDAYQSSDQLDAALKKFVENAVLGAVEGPVLVGQKYSMYKLVDKIQAPDSVRISQLMLPAMTDEKALTALTDSLMGVIKGGKSFAEVAQEATNGQTNGDMGWQTESSLVRGVDAKFKETVFNAPVSEVFVTKSTYGTHLIQVVEKTKPVAKYKVANVQMAVSPSTETYNKLYNDLNQYISKNNTLDKFKSAASESGYVCQSEITLTKNQPSLASIGNSRQVIRWAFEHSKGDISDIFECQDRFVIAATEGSLKEGVRPLNTVSAILKRELLNEKKAEKMVAELKSKNFTSMDQYAQAMNSTLQSVKFVTFSTPNISGIGAEPVINAKVMSAEVGKMTEPLVGKSGVFILNITAKKAGEEAFNHDAQKLMLQSSNTYRMYQAAGTLKSKAKIEDNRIRFY